MYVPSYILMVNVNIHLLTIEAFGTMSFLSENTNDRGKTKVNIGSLMSTPIFTNLRANVPDCLPYRVNSHILLKHMII